uniref:Uncharacterized protein n=1 Tax=Amphimedon queenslandica TaxID=400682 RepID=A0A1X7TTL0_AMPQE
MYRLSVDCEMTCCFFTKLSLCYDFQDGDCQCLEYEVALFSFKNVFSFMKNLLQSYNGGFKVLIGNFSCFSRVFFRKYSRKTSLPWYDFCIPLRRIDYILLL